MNEEDAVQIAVWIDEVLSDHENENLLDSIRAKVNEKMGSFPLYPESVNAV